MRFRPRLRTFLANLVSALLLAACASPPPPPSLPAVSPVPDLRAHLGKFVWVDLVTREVDRAKEFYGALFGWSFDGDEDYAGIRYEGRPVGGIVRLRREEAPAGESAWIGSLSVSDVDAAAALVQQRGGTLEIGPLDAGPRGRLAVVTDPGGALVALLRAPGGDPPDAPAAPGEFLWRELWTRDAVASIAFYSELVGYEPRLIEFDGNRYQVLERDGQPRAGVIEAPMERVPPLWLPYVRVEDPVATAERARSLGARIVLQDADAAILVDPVGAAFGVQRWSDEEVQP